MVYSSGVKEYKYIVYLNGIVWESVKASNKKEALEKAELLVRDEWPAYKIGHANTIVVETVRTFLGK